MSVKNDMYSTSGLLLINVYYSEISYIFVYLIYNKILLTILSRMLYLYVFFYLESNELI